MADGRVLASGVVYVDAQTGRIAAVQDANDPPPAGFEDAPVIATRGTLYPGLIELHNHLCYNLLTLWQVPRQWMHRDQWPNHPDYLKLIRGPAQTLGASLAETYLPAIVRYVEAKCLMGGVTSSQGITLRGVNTVVEFRGNVRNVESSGRPDLPSAGARIGDLKADEADGFLNQLKTKKCVLLHLSEGQRANETALSRFDRLQLTDDDKWAITPALAGIHSAALRRAELDILGEHGAAVVWSPLSNLLLYGTTADIAYAKQLGLRIGLGSDWSPTGSKNLLGELKVARLYSQNNGQVFSDEELVAMVTRDAARILGWDGMLGQLKPGQYADVLVIRSTDGDPYARLLEADEADIGLVVIGGQPRYGRRSLMTRLTTALETWKVGRKTQAFCFEASSPGNPISVDLTLKAAQTRLHDGLQRLPELARNLPDGDGGLLGLLPVNGSVHAGGWRLNFDDDVDTAFLASASASVPYKDVAVPIELDPLTVVDDPDYLERIAGQLDHVPDYIRHGLASLY